MSQDVPVYLVDLTLSAFAPEPVEPPPAANFSLNLTPFEEADLNLALFFGQNIDDLEE